MRRTYARSSGATRIGRRPSWTHILAPTAPGAISASRLQSYSTRSNLAKARRTRPLQGRPRRDRLPRVGVVGGAAGRPRPPRPHPPGDERLRAIGKLDIEIMKTLAPVAQMNTYNSR